MNPINSTIEVILKELEKMPFLTHQQTIEFIKNFQYTESLIIHRGYITGYMDCFENKTLLNSDDFIKTHCNNEKK